MMNPKFVETLELDRNEIAKHDASIYRKYSIAKFAQL